MPNSPETQQPFEQIFQRFSDIISQPGSGVMKKVSQIQNSISEYRESIQDLSEDEQHSLFTLISRFVSTELHKIVDAAYPIYCDLKPDLDACYRNELDHAQLAALQKKIYDAFDGLVRAHIPDVGNEEDFFDNRSIYDLVHIVQQIGKLIGNLGDMFGLDTFSGNFNTFMHDIAGKEMHGIQGMGEIINLEGEFIDNAKNPAKRELHLRYLTRKKGQIRSSGVGILKFLACTELLAWRLNPDVTLENTPIDLKDLIEKTAFSQSVRFTYEKRVNLAADIQVDDGTDTTLLANESMLYIIFMNVVKNAGKIMVERKTPTERQGIDFRLFDEDGVLYVHYSDQIGGLDLTKLFQSAVAQVREITKTKAGQTLPFPLSVISQGSFRSADYLSMRDLCELIFLDRVHAREGGSGIGMTEAKDLMTQNGMYLSTALNRDDGTQFLFAFPRVPHDEKTLREKVTRTEQRLDREENTRLGFAEAA